jgi:hypothetical protein
VLNVPLGSSRSEYRSAYIALAKRWHPDLNPEPGAVAEFKRLTAAYAQALQSFDKNASQGKTKRRSATILQCAICGSRIVHPRRAEYLGIISFLFRSWKRRVIGVFCRKCARSTAMKETAISLVLGWWSPQGLLLTVTAIASNLRGGRQDEAVNFRLSCHNLFALADSGDVASARHLARAIDAQHQSPPLNVAYLVKSLLTDPQAGREKVTPDQG